MFFHYAPICCSLSIIGKGQDRWGGGGGRGDPMTIYMCMHVCIYIYTHMHIHSFRVWGMKCGWTNYIM